MEKITLLHFVNSNNTEVDVLSPQEVYKITPVVDKNNKRYLMVDYYDSEFCLYSTLFSSFYFLCFKFNMFTK